MVNFNDPRLVNFARRYEKKDSTFTILPYASIKCFILEGSDDKSEKCHG